MYQCHTNLIFPQKYKGIKSNIAVKYINNLKRLAPFLFGMNIQLKQYDKRKPVPTTTNPTTNK